MRYSYLLLAAGLILGGCEAVLNPSPLPRGYTHHRSPYKAPPGPEARDIGYAYTAARNAEVLEDLRYVARDLVERLRQETGITYGTLYIRSGGEDGAGMDTFHASFDHVLREVLTGEGYALARFPGEGKALYFAAGETPEQDGSGPGTPETGPYKDMVMSLSLWDGAVEVGRVSGVYAMPVYGYSKPGVLEEILPVIEDAEPGE